MVSMRQAGRGCALIAVSLVIIAWIAGALAAFGVWKQPASSLYDLIARVPLPRGCSGEVAKRVASPDGQFVAELWVMTCADDFFSVEVRGADGKLSKSILSGAVRGPIQNQVGLRWADNRTLIVDYETSPDLVDSKDFAEWQGLHFIYLQGVSSAVGHRS